jgi:hypothetical protein
MKTIACFALCCLMNFSCSPKPESLSDFFPDRKGEMRIFSVLNQGEVTGSYVLETWSTAEAEGGNRVLFFKDPRHSDLLGRWQFVLKEDSLLIEFPVGGMRFPLFVYPPGPMDDEWKELEPGLRARYSGTETIDVPAGRFKNCVQISAEVDSIFLAKLALSSEKVPVHFDLWLAPFEGPVRFQVEENYREELRERY